MSAPIGGQAVLEGVMMRGPRNWAVAVRTPWGTIERVAAPVTSAMARHRWLRLPVVRGVVALGESLSIGFRALAVSANYAAQEEQVAAGAADAATVEAQGAGEIPKSVIIGSFVVAIGFAIALFKVTPALLTDLLPVKSGAWFVLTEGAIRVSILIAYLAVISLMPSLKRVFQYHAAEHKAINAYEDGCPLEPERVQRYSLIHPRCGTAFLLWVMVIAIFVYAGFGKQPIVWQVVTRIGMLPVIAGLAYELIRFAGKHAGSRVLMTLLAPGLWLQRLTTRQPTLDQIEVSIRALQEVLELEGTASSAEARQVEIMA